MPFRTVLSQAATHPRKLFLIDCCGAILSAVLYGAVLARFTETFGMPQSVLYWLALLASLYAIYSGGCYLLRVKHWRPYLRIIAAANLAHCGLTLGLTIAYRPVLTTVGILYFVGEILVVASLAAVELTTAATAVDRRRQGIVE